MKKKILITMSSMFIGGAERSLIGLLESIDYNKFDVFLFLYRHEGEFLNYLPKEVKLLPEVKAYTTFDRPIKELFIEGSISFGVARVLSKIALKFRCIIEKKKGSTYKCMQYTSRYLLPLLPSIEGEYDLAINYLGIHDVLINKISARVKVGWLHTDYSKMDSFLKMDKKLWSTLDFAINVSKECTKVFRNYLPQLSSKCITIENIISPNFIRKESDIDVSLEISKNDKTVILCSVGRFSEAKNFDNIPDICKRLIEYNCNVRWYLIGYGADELIIKKRIMEAGMEQNVIILGKKINPYPYIKTCDIYVQPSRYEGKAVTVREAQILCKPVIITNFATAKSQLNDRFDGVIVPMDNEGCAKGLKEVIEDKALQQRLIENCRNSDYGNEREREKIYKLMEI